MPPRHGGMPQMMHMPKLDLSKKVVGPMHFTSVVAAMNRILGALSYVLMKMMESSLLPRRGSVSRARQKFRLCANTLWSTGLFLSGNAATAVIHRDLFVMAMFTFATIVMIEIRNEVEEPEMKYWRGYHAVETNVYFLSQRAATDTLMGRFLVANRFIYVRYAIHHNLTISLKSSLDQEIL